MTTYVLDSSAVLRYLDGEAGSDRVSEIITGHLAGECGAIISSVHWGEIAGHTCKRRGRAVMDLVLSRLAAFGIPNAARREKTRSMTALPRLLQVWPAISPQCTEEMMAPHSPARWPVMISDTRSDPASPSR